MIANPETIEHAMEITRENILRGRYRTESRIGRVMASIDLVESEKEILKKLTYVAHSARNWQDRPE